MSDEPKAPETEENIECILIAEDSVPNRKILTHLLQKLGYGVYACEDGKEAWEKLEDEETKNIVAIISDIMMPNEDGLQLLKRVRESDKYKETPFLLVTAVSDKEYILQAKALKVNGYILKPVTFQRVTAKLQALFPEKRFPKLAA